MTAPRPGAARLLDVQVRTDDALRYPADVLVLKYAQKLYGLDEVVIDRAGPGITLPAPGEHVVVPTPPGVAARVVLLLGVPAIGDFDYAAVQEFGRRAVAAAAREVPEAHELVVTVHGLGFGLDEQEAFLSEAEGIVEAGLAGAAGHALERVVVVEHDRTRAERLRALLDPQVTPPRRAIVRADERPHAFVAMPFSPAFDDLFHYGIESPVRRVGLLCERMDRSAFTGEIMERMKRRIRSAKVVVADISGANPNVYLEIGYAWAAGVPTILLWNGETEPHFDVRGHKHLRYGSIHDAERKLDAELAALLHARSATGRASGDTARR